jgi:hypothetical protein
MKQLVTLVLFILIFSIIQSCCGTGYACFSPPPDLQCFVVDKKGNDLMNQSLTPHFDTSTFKIFAVSDGQKKTLNYSLFLFQNKNMILCNGNYSDNSNNYVLFQFDSTNIDTIRHSGRSVTSECCTHFEVTKLSLNGREVSRDSILTIVK